MTEIIGLTGAIATGKSFVGQCLREHGIAVLDVDTVVHSLLDKDGDAVSAVVKRFPECVLEDGIDRIALGNRVFRNLDDLKDLEAIMHPLVRQKEEAFINLCRDGGASFAVLEVTLLYQTDAHQLCNRVIMTTVDAQIQKKRALQRPGMTEEKYQAILERQGDFLQYQGRVDLMIDTGSSRGAILDNIAKFLQAGAA